MRIFLLLRRYPFVGALLAFVAIVSFSAYTPLLFFLKVGGVLLILFLPGFLTSVVFFPFSSSVFSQQQSVPPDDRATLDAIERVAISVLLSIIISSGIVYGLVYLSRLWKINVVDPFYFFVIMGVLVFFIGIIAVLRVRFFSQRMKK